MCSTVTKINSIMSRRVYRIFANRGLIDWKLNVKYQASTQWGDLPTMYKYYEFDYISIIYEDALYILEYLEGNYVTLTRVFVS